MRSWIIRAGRVGEREAWALEQGVSGGGFVEVGDLTAARSREDVSAAVRLGFPGGKPAAINNLSAQLWALKARIAVGDLVVLPLKTTGQIALGRVAGEYEYRGAAQPDQRHIRAVDWRRTDLARTAVKQDLLYSLGAFLTICEVSRHSAADRLRTLLETGQDPGSAAVGAVAKDHTRSATPEVPQAEEVPEEGGSLDLERLGRDQIATWLSENVTGHRLSDLVASVLEAEGLRCTVSPPGPDGGIDIFAGRGVLGLDSPRLVVQVKSEAGAVGAPVVQQLQGALASHGADQALLVAWGGVTRAARQLLANQQFRVRIWDAEDLIDALCQNYSSLPEDLRAEVPLKQVWTVVRADNA